MLRPYIKFIATVFGAGYLIFWRIAWIWVNPPEPKTVAKFLRIGITHLTKETGFFDENTSPRPTDSRLLPGFWDDLRKSWLIFSAAESANFSQLLQFLTISSEQ